jgi:hypothetical protein
MLRKTLLRQWRKLSTTLITAMLMHTPAMAENARWYQIEVIVAQSSGIKDGGELLDRQAPIYIRNKGQRLTRLNAFKKQVRALGIADQDNQSEIADVTSNVLNTKAASSTAAKKRTVTKAVALPSLDNTPYVALPPEYRQLNHLARRLKSAKNYSVLYHEAWRQPLVKTAEVDWIELKTGAKSGGRHTLEGRIGLRLGNFLHIHTELLLNKLRKQGQNSSQKTNNLILAQYKLWEQRKVRSNELNYFDHPRLVVLARIIPFVPSMT